MDEAARRYGLAALSLTLALLAYRLALLAFFSYDLHGDEAQYWTWAQAPAFGYYSKPPMVAWLILATTSVCGDGIACIKLSSPLLHAATGSILYLCGRELYGPRAGFWSAALYGLMPAVGLSALVISTDAPLLFFWSVALYAFIRAIREDRSVWWLAAGVAGGLGLLSKYNMGIFAVSALAFLLWDRRHRRRLATRGPWLAAAAAAAVYAPNLWWNAANGFVSYRHTGEISQVARAVFAPQELAGFLLSQFVVFGPASFALLLVLIARLRRTAADEAGRLLLSFIVPWLAVMTFMAYASRVFANWSAPAYVAATVLVAGWAAQQTRRGLWLALLLVPNLLLTIGLYHYEGLARVAGIELTRHTDPFKRVKGWRELGSQAAAVAAPYPGVPLLAEERMLTAELLYYVEPRREVLKWNPDGRPDDHYDLVASLTGREGQDFLFVTAYGVTPAMAARFASQEKVGELRVTVYPDWRLDYDVWLLRGFRGY